MSIAKKGNKNPMKNPETAKKVGEKLKGRIGYWKGRKRLNFTGKNNPMFGKKHNKDSLKKISEANKGKVISKEQRIKISNKLKGRISPRKGIPFSESSKLKLSKTMKERNINKGNKNFFWNGGIARLPYPFEFNKDLKLKIKKRDKFTCQECGMLESELGYSLHIHHIDFNKNNNNLNNLISLCRNCHSQTQLRKEIWINHFKNKFNLVDV